jgi:hypothetical protein
MLLPKGGSSIDSRLAPTAATGGQLNTQGTGEFRSPENLIY